MYYPRCRSTKRRGSFRRRDRNLKNSASEIVSMQSPRIHLISTEPSSCSILLKSGWNIQGRRCDGPSPFINALLGLLTFSSFTARAAGSYCECFHRSCNASFQTSARDMYSLPSTRALLGNAFSLNVDFLNAPQPIYLTHSVSMSRGRDAQCCNRKSCGMNAPRTFRVVSARNDEPTHGGEQDSRRSFRNPSCLYTIPILCILGASLPR